MIIENPRRRDETMIRRLRPTAPERRLGMGWGVSLVLATLAVGTTNCDLGVIGRECTIDRSDVCADDEVCTFRSESCGDPGEVGRCEPRPSECSEEDDPVCGCDGRTYGNACSARLGGVQVASGGACEDDPKPDPGDVCGGLRGLRCDDDEYCDLGEQATCGSADLEGECRPLPEACFDVYAPVCACDGTTYANDCEANAAGVSVFTEGACDMVGRDCGGALGLDCGPTAYCDLGNDATCSDTDRMGECRARPTGSCPPVYEPVCDCDGRVHPSRCDAWIAGVGVYTVGECGDPTVECSDGDGCGDGEFCAFSLDAACGTLDPVGECVPLAEVCTDEVDPVCGCDGRTYGNACEAEAAGVSLASRGGCPMTMPFACGGSDVVCEVGTYCEIFLPGVPDQSPSQVCRALPDACGAAPSCTCLQDEGGVGPGSCQEGGPGQLTVTLAAP